MWGALPSLSAGIIEPSGFWLASKGVREDRLPLRIEAAGAGGGAREARLWLAWFSSAQVFAILNKCAVSGLSSFSAETCNEG